MDRYGKIPNIPKYTKCLHPASCSCLFLLLLLLLFNNIKEGLVGLTYQFINPCKPVKAGGFNNTPLQQFARCFDNKKQVGCCSPPLNYHSILRHVKWLNMFYWWNPNLQRLNLHLGVSELVIPNHFAFIFPMTCIKPIPLLNTPKRSQICVNVRLNHGSWKVFNMSRGWGNMALFRFSILMDL